MITNRVWAVFWPYDGVLGVCGLLTGFFQNLRAVKIKTLSNKIGSKKAKSK